jgi:hypothetical protein
MSCHHGNVSNIESLGPKVRRLMATDIIGLGIIITPSLAALCVVWSSGSAIREPYEINYPLVRLKPSRENKQSQVIQELAYTVQDLYH